MLAYLYIFTSSKTPLTPNPYYIYAASKEEAKKKYLKRMKDRDTSIIDLPSDLKIERRNF